MKRDAKIKAEIESICRIHGQTPEQFLLSGEHWCTLDDVRQIVRIFGLAIDPTKVPHKSAKAKKLEQEFCDYEEF